MMSTGSLMSRDPEHRARELFQAVFARAVEERRTYLDQACAGDQGLRREVESLLAHHDEIQGVPTPPAAGDPAAGDATLTAPPHQRSGTPDRIGSYRILRKLGEGGMGEVYEAEQERPIRRRVKLKLIQLGMDTREMVARFESERQALAIMNHPAIARVYDAGESSDGRPYFAMKYVAGVPINDYCDREHLDTRERLAFCVRS